MTVFKVNQEEAPKLVGDLLEFLRGRNSIGHREACKIVITGTPDEGYHVEAEWYVLPPPTGEQQ